MRNRNGPVRSQLSVLKCWGWAVGRPRDAESNQGCLLSRRETWGVGAAAGDSLRGPEECGRRERRSGEIRYHFSKIQPKIQPHRHLPLCPSSPGISPHPCSREDKWAQSSALAKKQKVLLWGCKAIPPPVPTSLTLVVL